MLYCVSQLYPVICMFIWAVLVFTDELGLLDFVLCIIWLFFGCQYLYQCNQSPGKTRPWNDILCVKQDVKLYSLFTIHVTMLVVCWYVNFVINCVLGQRTQLRDSSVQSGSGRGVYWCYGHRTKQRVCWRDMAAFYDEDDNVIVVDICRCLACVFVSKLQKHSPVWWH